MHCRTQCAMRYTTALVARSASIFGQYNNLIVGTE